MTQPYTERYVVAVTGHRNLGDAATVDFVATTFDALLTHLQRQSAGGIVVLSGLAQGADTLFAEAALARGIDLEACLACAELIDNFAPGLERQRFLALQTRCRRLHHLPFVERSKTAYMALGQWLVDSCDLLIAAWNGLPAAGLGGTGDVVAYARRQGRPVIHIHTLQKLVIPL